MLRLLFPILLLTTGQATAEVVRLTCSLDRLREPSSVDLILNIETGEAELINQPQQYPPSGKHPIIEITEKEIVILNTGDPDYVWSLDRYTLRMTPQNRSSEFAPPIEGRDCTIVERKI